jgi:orotate phosphoribosyltransferase
MDLLQLFREKGAYLEGHFLLSSGLHSPNYMQCAKVLQYPDIAGMLGTDLAQTFEMASVDVVLSPALGGIIIGHEVARALGVRFIFCEREGKEFQLRRGFEIRSDEKVIVVEDVVTTGLSTRETIAVAQREGAEITGVGSIVDRSVQAVDFPAPFQTLLKLPLATHKAEECPLCAENLPLVKPGSRKQ